MAPSNRRSIISLSFLPLFLFFFFSSNAVLGLPSGPKPRSEDVQQTCENPTFPSYFDFSVKSRSDAPGKCPNDRQLFRRESADADDYSCSETKPCKNGACCPKATGQCNYGPDACGTNGESPNDVCWSNCDAHAECGRYSDPPNKECPLNVCCSEYGFCGMTEEFCTTTDDPDTGCQSNCEQPKSGKSGTDVQKRIIGYYESWAHDRSCQGMDFKDIPVESLTHLNFAFGYVTPGTFEIAPMEGVDAKLFSDFTALKKRNSGLKATISLGGWSFNDNDTSTQPVFSDLVSSASNRQKFINNLFSFMRYYGFDGVDFDWEYPGAPDRGGHDDDGENYTQLMKELKDAIANQPEDYEVSFTAPTSYWYLRWFDLTNMMKHVDFMNLMSYDLHGVWDADDPIGSHVLAHTNLTEIKQSLDLLWRNDVDPGKVNLGLGFYGRSFQLADSSCWQPGCLFKGGANAGACSKNSGTLTYKEIMDVIDTYNVSPYYDKENAVKYITWNKDQWVSYDDQETFQQKVKLANDQGLSGLLIWAVDQDTLDLAALRGVLYPNSLKAFNSDADNADYWKESGGGDCRVTECGGSCTAGEVPITTQPCGKSTGFWGGYHSDSKDSTLCCPIDAAPDAKKCQWHGTAPLCDGQCDPGQVALESNKWGDGDYCTDGLKFYCCDVPDAKAIDCSWKDSCSSDETLMTFEGSFLETIADFSQFFGLVGEALAEVLDEYDLDAGKMFCCSNEEAKNWKNCEWAGTTGKGVYSCDDNHCATGHQVELAKSEYGECQNCFPHLERTRAFCCDPESGKSPFLPVPLDYLFPNPPDEDDANPEFKLETDDTWGTGTDEGTEGDPDKSAFGFVIITSPEEIQQSLDKRDGSHWEVFDCFDAVSEEEQTVRMVCTDYSENSNCNKIYLGHGLPGTILEMPDGCGPGKYAVAKNMTVSENQELPHHIRKRELIGRKIYDLTFDYDFARVPRDLGESLMRIDFSNEEGYWDNVVNKAGETKRKRSLEEVGRNHKRWLEEEWRDDKHFGALDKHEMHKRWFGSSVISWLKELITTGTAKVTEELNHQVDETITAILVDEQWGPCPVGPATAQANIKAEISAHLQVDTSFGITIITTLNLGSALDLSQSYLYFKNKGSVTASFSLDAVASLSYDSGDIKMIGLDDFPGATFRVPGIVTVGPNLAVYGSLSASFVVAGHLDAQVNIASWETQQTYPQESGYEPKGLEDPNRDGSQTLGTPEFNWEVSASGQVEVHLKPTITFGIVFDAKWKVDNAAVHLVADGSVVFYASAAAGSDPSTCPFKYGINAQAQLYAQLDAPDLFGWGGTTRIPIAELPTKDITPGGKGEICPAQEPTKRDVLALRAPYRAREPDVHNHSRYVPALDPWGNALPAALSFIKPSGSLLKRENHVIPPMFTIPDSFKKCPGGGGETPGEACELCYTIGLADDDTSSKARRALIERDGDDASCLYIPPPPDALCTEAKLSKRVLYETKWYTWNGAKYPFSEYPQCGTGSTDLQVSKWYMPNNDRTQACTPAIVKNSIRNSDKTVAGISVSKFATDHVFEVGIITMFLQWLSGTSKNYANGGPIPFPAGWTAADNAWVEQVLGVAQTGNNNGFVFQYNGESGDWLDHVTSEAIGSSWSKETRALLAVLLQDVNSVKKDWTQGNQVSPPATGGSQSGATQEVRNSAAVFQYLQHADIQSRWTQPSNEVEAICDAFDTAYTWGQSPAGTTEPATTQQRPGTVTSWGLRTLWCYWIDNHIDRAQRNIANYLTTSQAVLNSFAGGQSQVAAHFITNHMTSGTGLANPNQMHFPRAANWANIPLPGTANSAVSTVSRYMLWGDSRVGGINNQFGPLGV